MIEEALKVIVSELDESLRRRSDVSETMAMLSNLAATDGIALPNTVGKVATFLVNIERETTMPRTPVRIDAGQERIAIAPPPVYISLLVMFGVNSG